MESKAATSRLPKMSANLMNCSMTALGNSGVGGDWPASTEGTTSVRTIRARRCMRSPKMLAQRKLSRRPFERKTSAAHHASHHGDLRSEEHTSELQSQSNLVCRLLLEKKKKIEIIIDNIQNYVS